MTQRDKIGYHASHEQFPPSRLLEFARAAEEAGFARAMCSDHLFPWSETQGHSGFAWSWLGAALGATSIPFGVVNAPGYRYHPVIVAQAAATLAEMFPGRFWLAVGSGEAMNEHITGEVWPNKADRNVRLKECADIMRALWRGETVSYKGHVTVSEAKVYSLPENAPLLVGAAITPETAAWMASWADALITAGQPGDTLMRIVDAWRSNGGEKKPLLLQQKLSFAGSYDEALHMAHEQWRTNIFASSALAELRLPNQFEDVAQYITPEKVAEHVRVSADPGQHAQWIADDFALGFDEIYLHNVNLLQREFIETFGTKVLGQF